MNVFKLIAQIDLQLNIPAKNLALREQQNRKNQQLMRSPQTNYCSLSHQNYLKSDRYSHQFGIVQSSYPSALLFSASLMGLLAVTAVPAVAKKPFESYTTISIPATSSNYTIGSGNNKVKYTFGNGNDLYLESITADSGKIYTPRTLADLVFVRREDNNEVAGERCNIFLEYSDSGKGNGDINSTATFPRDNSGDCSIAEVLKDLVINRGALDVFSNSAPGGSEQPNNIERIDFVYSSGIVAPTNSADLQEAGHIVMEKNGNNPVKVAAITAIDAAGNPTAFSSTVVTINSSDYGKTGAAINNNFLFDPSTSGGVQNPEYEENKSEQIGGVLVTLADFGIGTGDTYYGFAMFGTDVADNANLLSTATFPKNTPHGSGNTGGADWQGGMGGFWSSLPTFDYGDAPDSYGTDATAGNSNNDPLGASHAIVPNLFLGTAPDEDINGFVDGTDNNGDATDDDDPNGTGTGNGDDEDNFTFPLLKVGDTSYTIPAANITATNNTGENATLHGWIDFNQNGKFEDTEHTSVTVDNGTDGGNPAANLTWNGITVGAAGDTYARFRLTTDSSIDETTPGGAASDGEVEDYQMTITVGNPDLAVDFCQAAAGQNILFIIDDSSSVDGNELIEQRNAVMSTLNDFVSKNLTGQAAIVGFDSVGRTVIDYTDITAANLSGFEAALNSNYGVTGSGTNWEAGFQAGTALGVDKPDVVFFFTDGVQNTGNSPEDEATQFKNAGAHIYGIGMSGLTVESGFRGITEGEDTVTYDGTNLPEADFAAITSYGDLKEQFTNAFLKNLCSVDYGDAPDTYGTDNIAGNSSNSNDPIGANHTIVTNLFLGAKPPDADGNGFVDGTDDNANATDDDDSSGTGTGAGNGDDEAILSLPTLASGSTNYTIPAENITATNNTGDDATLHAWIDFNKNGVFDDTEYASAVVNSGTDNNSPRENLTWNNINVGAEGTTYVRFRLTTDTSIVKTTPGGNAQDGEVEDWQVAIASSPSPPTGNSCISLISPSTATFNSANYPLDTELQDNSSFSFPLSLYGGTMQFNASLDGAASWSNGVQIQTNATIGDHIYLQPRDANEYLSRGNRAIYTLSFPNGAEDLSMVLSGLNNDDGTTISASYQGTPVSITSSNFSNLSTGMVLSDNDSIIGDETVVSTNQDGSGSVLGNDFTLTIPGIIDTLTVVSGKEDGSDNNVTIGLQSITYKDCSSPVSSDPGLLLVKRITSINPGKPEEIQFNDFVDDPNTTHDNDPLWPDSDENPNSNSNLFLRGVIDGGEVKPDDEVEYTIYFLSNGDEDVREADICDVIPNDMTFVRDAYGVEVGIGLGFNPAIVPTAPNKNLSNLLNDDEGDFYAPGTTPPANLCKKIDSANNLVTVDGTNNTNGAIIVRPADALPPATLPGQPANSYGFIRFRGKVK